jgi:electron-transferring-flavoprotein dehydrogenase
VTLGFVVGLDYENPYLSPFEEFQRWKTHPEIRKTLEGGKRLGYGARSITAGGILSLPKTVFPGGAFVGCEAGYLNSSRIKGSHAAIKSGMLAAEAAFDALVAGRQHDELAAYPAAFELSWLHAELDKSRNFKQWFKKGFLVAALMTGIEQWLLPRLGIHSPPWTVHRPQADHLYLRPAAECKPIAYPKPDNVITFDRLSSVFVSNTNHAEEQPAHLTLKDPSVPVAVNLAKFARKAAIARPRSTSSSTTAAPSGCRSTRRTASTARPATSRIRPRTSSGSRPKAAAVRPTSACEDKRWLNPIGSRC